jgi:hypothetical protein
MRTHPTKGYDFSEVIAALNSGRIAAYLCSVSVVFLIFCWKKAKLVHVKKKATTCSNRFDNSLRLIPILSHC